MNYSISIDLKKLKRSGVLTIPGRSGKKRCIVIPLEDNPEIFEGEKGVYLNLNAVELKDGKYGQTHFVKGSLPKELFQTMSKEERDARPFLGHMKELLKADEPQRPLPPAPEVSALGDDEDLPF